MREARGVACVTYLSAQVAPRVDLRLAEDLPAVEAEATMPAQHDNRIRRLCDTDYAFPIPLDEAARILLSGISTDRVSQNLISERHQSAPLQKVYILGRLLVVCLLEMRRLTPPIICIIGASWTLCNSSFTINDTDSAG